MIAPILLAAALAAAPAGAAELRVRVTGGAPGEGRALVQLYLSKHAWMQAPFAQAAAEIGADGTGEAVFGDVPPGPAGLAVLYDRDGNGEMTLNAVGMPTEFLSFSNDPETPGLTIPDWAAVRFVVPAEGAETSVTLRRGAE